MNNLHRNSIQDGYKTDDENSIKEFITGVRASIDYLENLNLPR